ncbi:HD domain-containing protein [Nocardioides guangzhouensis]|uniref:HD domain-containing protein n=1 Tax=Nocardioides guangzhouensis TaxID=2497878 RepID=A0A4Q4Z2M3_9ACTN|nr:HD domain-containing protein [Nocardioides guangzhouensis]
MESRLRLVDLLAALSVATDLGMGQPPGTALRCCLLATGLARSRDLAEDDVRSVFLGTMLRHIGCTATAAVEVRVYGGNELVSRRAAQPADFGNPREMVRLTLSSGQGAGLRRPALIARSIRGDVRHGTEILLSVCDAASVLAGRLGLAPEVQDCVAQQFERWDGKGPRRLAQDEVSLPARVGDVATQAVLFLDAEGPDAAVAMVEQRAGGWFDPEVAAAFGRVGLGLMDELSAVDPWSALLEAEPRPVEYIGEPDLDRVARCFADMVDLKSSYTVGHSAEVARLAEGAARSLGLPEPDVVDLRRAAMLHDLGKVGVSSVVWEKTGQLTRTEWEQVRLHPYHTERILACSASLAPVARIAGLHHERMDGSGYHHGLRGAAIPVAARVLAAAVAFRTATEDRPHRQARTREEAAEHVTQDATSGGLDADCVAAVIEAAGQPRPRVRRQWPAGLSDREVEVLRLVARGLSNHQIAKRLVISRRTAEHHVQHIYAKIGHPTRAAATLFAMEHDLLNS